MNCRHMGVCEWYVCFSAVPSFSPVAGGVIATIVVSSVVLLVLLAILLCAVGWYMCQRNKAQKRTLKIAIDIDIVNQRLNL